MDGLVRNCGNCACMLAMQVGEGAKAQKAYLCRRNQPRVVQQVARGAVMTTGRGDQDTQVSAILTYEPTMPDLICFDGWRPEGTPPGLFESLMLQGEGQALSRDAAGKAVGTPAEAPQ